MAEKISDRLRALVNGDERRSAPVVVRLSADLSGNALKSAVHDLTTRIDGAEYLSISGTVHGQVPLNDVPQVSELPGVEWIDLEKEVPIDELIDPY